MEEKEKRREGEKREKVLTDKLDVEPAYKEDGVEEIWGEEAWGGVGEADRQT